ncbi:Mannose-P-dolichol utilization defect 1 protein-like protein [Auxenochlorella protothecoides]|nr:Mannose-P-dolichol utilization defect 1 protein-like protein [Auxenochlorella protothecoides]KFM24854.1 Mannose-P-dolichol utilization defect 1 protein-like protein [Auxenochlorella protothecoides]RMZ52607.1 hypothetical protein APUTEX25_000726 [Auxenochlorella protothecoides]|eukprot:RMZ52607.1 hypothetical protein APUTEX25_000726 [Auxenochlorella protothecoides]
MPQIVRIYKSKSVEGLSTMAFVNETVVCIVNMAYNLRHGYPFSSYGDAATCGLQNTVILGLMFRHGCISNRNKVLITVGLTAFAASLCFGVCSDALLAQLQASSVLLLALGGRLPQIWMNIRNGGSGELSMGSAALSVAGNLGRLFTTLTLVDDKLVLVASVSQLLLNAILLWQTAQTAWRKKQGTGPVYKAA